MRALWVNCEGVRDSAAAGLRIERARDSAAAVLRIELYIYPGRRTSSCEAGTVVGHFKNWCSRQRSSGAENRTDPRQRSSGAESRTVSLSWSTDQQLISWDCGGSLKNLRNDTSDRGARTTCRRQAVVGCQEINQLDGGLGLVNFGFYPELANGLFLILLIQYFLKSLRSDSVPPIVEKVLWRAYRCRCQAPIGINLMDYTGYFTTQHTRGALGVIGSLMYTILGQGFQKQSSGLHMQRQNMRSTMVYSYEG